MKDKPVVFYEAFNSGWSNPKAPSWFPTTSLTYSTKEQAEEANKHFKSMHKNSHFAYRIVKTTVHREVVS